MPMYEFICDACKGQFEALARYDESGKYPTVQCPKCQSNDKKKIPSMCSFNFTNPVGTDRWNGGMGHDYRFKTNIPNVQAERKVAETLSHMGADPYQAAKWDDSSTSDEGITDVDRETFTL